MVVNFRMVVQYANGKWRNVWRYVIANGDSTDKYKHSIVYSVGLIITDSMPVACVHEITPFAISHFGQPF